MIQSIIPAISPGVEGAKNPCGSLCRVASPRQVRVGVEETQGGWTGSKWPEGCRSPEKILR